MTSGGEGGAGSLGLDGVGDGADASPPAGVAKAGTALIGVGKWTVLARVVLATRPSRQRRWRRRRHLPAVVAAVVDIGKLQDSDDLDSSGVAEYNTCFQPTRQAALI